MIRKYLPTGKTLSGIVLLSVLLTACLCSVINPISEGLLPTKSVTISRVDNEPGRQVTILYEDYAENEDELFMELKEANSQNGNGWEFVQGVKSFTWTRLVDTPESNGITISSKISPRKYITFLCNRGGGIVEISIDGKITLIDTYKDQEQSDILRYYVFGDFKRIVLVKAVLYSVSFVLVFVLMCLLAHLIGKSITVPEILEKPIGKAEYLLCAGLFFGVSLILYYVIGIPNYLQAGDEMAYWITGINIVYEKGFSLDYLSKLFSLRGYWCYIPQSLAILIGKELSFDASVVWILFLSSLWSWFVCGILPGMYRRMTGKETTRVHLIPIIVIMLTTWRMLLTSVMMDGLGMVMFFAFVFFLLGTFEEKNRILSGAAAGFCASVSCSFRAAHIIGVVGVFLYLLIECFRRKELRRTVAGISFFGLTFFLVCIPQLFINLRAGHIGIFPYDQDGVYYGQSVRTWSSDYAMAHGNVAYPLLATDDQMLSMKSSRYDNDSIMTMEQLFDIYADSPIESIMLIVKKLFIGFDQKTNIAFPGDGEVPWRETSGMLFSLWNYFVLLSGIYVLFRDKEVNQKEKWIAGLIFLLLVIPETFMKIEWRYVLSGYFIIYYFFSYHFVVPLFRDQQERVKLARETNYLSYLAVLMFACLTLSFMFLA